MSKQTIYKTLNQLNILLAAIKQHWYIIGTTGLLLSGFDVEPNDIDILTNTQTADAINIMLGDFEVPVILKDDGKFRSNFSRYLINGVSIEVMGDLEVNTLNGWTAVLPLVNDPDQIELGGKHFYIPSKIEQAAIYKLFGRKKDEVALKLLNAI